jgi:O-antigen ligase
LLNGSRQYAIGLAIVAIFPFIKLNLKTYIISGILIVILPFASTIIENNFSDLAIIERFSSDELERENEDGRSSIWKTGFNRMFDENPIWGLGFRNFGIVDDVSDPNSLTVVIRKDNAHGFFQEVFIEHGVILGLLLFISFLFSFFELRSYLVNNNSLFNSIFIILIGFIIPNFFTGYIMSSMGYYFLGLFLYNFPKLSLQK